MELSGKDRYNPDLIPTLEAFVDKQIASKSFDLSTNQVLLRMYQFFPEKTNSTVLVKILVKALMQLPGTDFTLCTYLVPQRFQLEEPIAKLSALAQYAECMQFKEFWDLASNCKYLWESIPGFEEAIRNFALHAINLTFSQITKLKLGEILSLSGPELDALVKEHQAKSGWQLVGDVVHLAENDLQKQMAKKKGSEMLNFNQFGPLLTL
uniref:Eukaryotic translation initiation factor 3 subunit K n=1 Tax=Chloropicon laureae TaxID=464258 RepID=A0A7S2YX86_9CHLO|eukprot:CAMPEP_0197500416 /NCGR_PEP_ID=MMETSP1311-20131121/61515_1 /TAXON_ID=464262 /ORGANISM="Genus nov. species nov., Strain RCC856" /LENGTH=208 /DNA_ID=CAMNT_0043046169 /DNA_START=17 /DNA_END=643 /DNA_ORIENTATION=+